MRKPAFMSSIARFSADTSQRISSSQRTHAVVDGSRNKHLHMGHSCSCTFYTTQRCDNLHWFVVDLKDQYNVQYVVVATKPNPFMPQSGEDFVVFFFQLCTMSRLRLVSLISILFSVPQMGDLATSTWGLETTFAISLLNQTNFKRVYTSLKNLEGWKQDTLLVRKLSLEDSLLSTSKDRSHWSCVRWRCMEVR